MLERLKLMSKNLHALVYAKPGTDAYCLLEKTAHYLHITRPHETDLENWNDAKVAITSYLTSSLLKGQFKDGVDISAEEKNPKSLKNYIRSLTVPDGEPFANWINTQEALAKAIADSYKPMFG